MLLALSKFFRVPIDYILRKEEEQQQQEQMIEKKLWNCIGIWINITETPGLSLGKDYWVVNYISIMRIILFKSVWGLI